MSPNAINIKKMFVKDTILRTPSATEASLGAFEIPNTNESPLWQDIYLRTHAD